MEANRADFSGYATKAGLKCSDGRTIMSEAFKHMDGLTVPLVWQHGHNDPANVLGHALLKSRDDGVYAYAYFNGTDSAKNAKALVEHKDIVALSIYANQLIERSKQVFHGVIKEVSLVLSGANPGALIDNVSLAHADGDIETLDDEAIIYTGLTLEHDDNSVDTSVDESVDESAEHSDDSDEAVYESLTEVQKEVVHGLIGAAIEDATSAEHSDDSVDQDFEAVYESLTDEQKELVHGMIGTAIEDATNSVEHAEDKTIQDVYDSLTNDQKDVVNYMIGAALESASSDSAVAQSDMVDNTTTGGETARTVQDVYNSLTDEQKDVVNYMIGAALETAQSSDSAVAQSDDMENITDDNSDTNNEGDLKHMEGTEMTHNVFEQDGTTKQNVHTLTHDQLKSIVDDAKRTGSFKEAFLSHAVEYGIENIDILFPDAKSVTGVPDVIGRRMEWVQAVLGNAKHSPFSRIKSTAVDLTADEARAKGYVKATLKKEEVIKLLKRVTTPTTIYKKQKLDRDDMVDITDLDVVAWLKAEMRIMLDEELAAAMLIGDGRDPEAEDKIDEACLRPIAFDDDMYAHQVEIASNVMGDSIVEAFLRARTFYKGSNTPSLYTTDAILTDLILLKDAIGRRLYANEADLASALRVDKIVVVEVLTRVPNLIGIVVNIADYTLGADKGGVVSMFDDFDIDYNQYKYLIETRVSGALTKPKSAIVVKRVAGTVVTPAVPTYVSGTHTITIPDVTGVVYQVLGVTKAAGDLVIAATTEVNAVPAATYAFAHNIDTDWTFTYVA